jgi:tetratricopeptide (TPR) repeat protein
MTDTFEPSSSAPPQPGLSRWIVIAAAILLVAGPLLGGGLHYERARWRIAAGIERWLDDDLPTALEHLDAAIALAPDYARAYELRGQWRIFAQDYAGALQDAEKVLEFDPTSQSGFHLKADALVYLDRANEAMQAWNEYAKLEKETLGEVQPVTLNGVAYYRALANTRLLQAQDEINKAIEELGPDPALLDTRGFIRYRLKQHRAALEDIDPAVIAVERMRDEQRHQAKTGVGRSILDPRTAEWELKLLDRNVAVIRYHRGLVYEALGRATEAERDFRRVRELGFEPGSNLF